MLHGDNNLTRKDETNMCMEDTDIEIQEEELSEEAIAEISNNKGDED